MDNWYSYVGIYGQEHVKRALEVAAAGGHNVLMSGPPGSGKTLLARSMPSILPRMTPSEALDVTRIYSVAGMLPSDVPLIRHRPFRAPHHTISNAGLVGGGQWPRPGEISLAHRGVLFLDEMPEFGQHGLEVLRQPLEDKVVTISRAQGSLTFPANFMLLGAQNPCPCGYYGDPEHNCTCSPMLISRYQKRLSGPLLDRIDIHVEVPRVPFQKLSDERRGEPSAAIRARVEAARARQTARFTVGAGLPAGSASVRDGTKPAPAAGLTTNADMGPTQVRDYCPVDETGRQLLGAAMQRLRPGDEPERAGVSPGAEAGADDRGPGGERADPAGAYRGGDPVPAATDGVVPHPQRMRAHSQMCYNSKQTKDDVALCEYLKWISQKQHNYDRSGPSERKRL